MKLTLVCSWTWSFCIFAHFFKFRNSFLISFTWLGSNELEKGHPMIQVQLFSNFFTACFYIPFIFSNLISNCSKLLDMRNLQEQVKKAFCYKKLLWPFTVWINWSSDFKNFEITRTIYSNSERSEQFLVTECFFNLFLEVSQI